MNTKLNSYQEKAVLEGRGFKPNYFGDIATLVDFVAHPQGGEPGCVLEIFNAIGESIAVVTVPISAIKPLAANEVLTIRPLEQAI